MQRESSEEGARRARALLLRRRGKVGVGVTGLVFDLKSRRSGASSPHISHSPANGVPISPSYRAFRIPPPEAVSRDSVPD